MTPHEIRVIPAKAGIQFAREDWKFGRPGFPHSRE